MPDPTPQATDKKPKPGAAEDQSSGDGRKAQTDEAKDEGAGKASVPVDDVTTANDQ